jgi:micrococcal nuclease
LTPNFRFPGIPVKSLCDWMCEQREHVVKGFKKIGLTFFCLLFVPCICWGWQGKVIGIAEGDTITVLHKSKRVRIRLYGVDCPEKGQHFGENAKQFTSDMVLGKEVEVQQPTLDEYGHMAGIVSIDGDILNRELVKHGYAWVYREYCTKA